MALFPPDTLRLAGGLIALDLSPSTFATEKRREARPFFSPFPFLTPAEEEEEEEEAIEQPYIRLWRWQGGGEDSPIISGKCDVGICYFVGEWGESEIV